MTAARGRRLLVFWLAFALLLPAAVVAAGPDDKTIVMLEVEGEREPRLRKSLERMVKTQHEILPGSTYRDAARRLRAVKLTPNNVKRVCAYLKVDGVLDGTVVQDEDGYKFVVRLRSASDGVIQKQIPMRLAQSRLSEKMADQLAQRLMVAIDDLPAVDKTGQDATRVAGAGDEDADEPPASKKGKKVAAARPAKGKKGKKAAIVKVGPNEVPPDQDQVEAQTVPSAREDEKDGDSDEEEDGDRRRVAMKDGGEEEEGGDEGGDDVDGSVDSEAASPAPATSLRTTPLLVNLGVSFIGRKLSFDYSGVAEEAPPGYSGSPVPGAYLSGEVYPAAFGGDRGVLANLGVGIVLDRVISLNSAVNDAAGMPVALPTRMWRYGANLRYRHNFGGDEPRGISMHGAVGYNTAGFSINKGDAPGGPTSVDVPNVNYKYVDIGIGGRIPIFGQLSFLAEAKFLAPLAAGQIQQPEQYGAASVTGIEGEAVLEYQITSRIHARAGGRLMQLKYSFNGNGTLDDRDANGEKDVSGASDRFLGGFVTGGYSF